MADATLGLYIHIPFCLSKCRYCDFCSSPQGEETKAAYTRALCHELAAAKTDRPVDTVFFGGGTPSLLSAADFLLICETIKQNFRLTPDVEWTAEANPATVDEAKLHAMREAGINRLSLGMQSAHDRELAALGRAHRAADLYEAVRMARAAGFDNLNLDLMFGIPHQTRESFSATLEEAIALGAEHLSVYSLQIEDGTPFYRERHSLPLPDEETEAAMTDDLLVRARAAGYKRYEISNYAKEGRECRHNLRYWLMRDYLGFGIAAHSLYAGRRFYNRADLPAYLRDPLGIREVEEELTPAAREYETVMLGLRLFCGIEDAEFASRFGYGFFEKYGGRLAPFLRGGFAVREGTRTRLTDRGMAVQNAILAKILD